MKILTNLGWVHNYNGVTELAAYIKILHESTMLETIMQGIMLIWKGQIFDKLVGGHVSLSMFISASKRQPTKLPATHSMLLEPGLQIGLI